MADYTIAQIVSAFRAENPDAANIPDHEIIRAIGTEDPHLLLGAKEHQGTIPPAEQTSMGSVIDAGKRFAGNAVGAVTGAVSGAYHAATDPATENDKVGGHQLPYVPMVAKRVLVDPQIDQLKKARDSYKAGHTSEAIGYGLAGILPVAGPAAAAVGEQAGTGDIAGAVGKGVGYLAMAKGAKAVGDVTSVENIQDLSAKAKMIRAEHPNVLGPLQKSHGIISGLANVPEAAAAAYGKIAPPILDRVARAKIALGAKPPSVPNPTGLPVEDPEAMAHEDLRDFYAQGGEGPVINRNYKTQNRPPINAADLRPSNAGYQPPAQGPSPTIPQFEQDELNAQNPGLPITSPTTPPAVDPEGMSQQNLSDFYAQGGEGPVVNPQQPPAVENPIQHLSPEVQTTVDAMIRRGKGAAGAPLAVINAPYLLDLMPELKGVPDGPQFDQMLYNKFQTVGHDLNAKFNSIPADRPVATGNAVSELNSISEKAASSFQNTEAAAVHKIAGLLGESGSTTWGTINSIRKTLFDKLDVSSGPGREVYKIFKDITERVDPSLADLNQKWFTLKTSTELAGMDPGGLDMEGVPRTGGGTRPKAEAKARLDAAKKARQIPSGPAPKRLKGGPL